MLGQRELTGIEIDKCTECFTVKIPEILKHGLDKLSAQQKAKLKEELLIVMAEHLHKNDFNPAKYLSSAD